MRLHYECEIDAPLETLFAFHVNPENLLALLSGWPGFRLLRHDGHVLPGAMTWVEQMVARSIPLVLGFEHRVYEPPRRFGEALIHGPFATFAHVHEFEAAGGRTIARDLLDVELALEYGGRLATRYLVAPALGRFFAHRHRRLIALAPGLRQRSSGGTPRTPESAG